MFNQWIDWVCSPGFLWSWTALALVVFFVLMRISAPYGRHGRSGWGPAIPAGVAWFAMEVVTLIGIGVCYGLGEQRTGIGTVLLCMYGGHYIYRSVIYPWLSPPSAAPVPLSVVLMAIGFNAINSMIVGGWLFVIGPVLPPTPVVVAGGCLFVLGFVVHVYSDAILRSLRRDRGPGYHIPDGFLYRWVSCPNYLGEIIQWLGFALLMNAMAGWSFVVWTIANLLPRALRHHRWYIEQFEDYPSSRRAILPGIL